MTKDEALKLALEALEELNNTNSYWWQEVDEKTAAKIEPAITAIKEALAQSAPYIAVSNDRMTIDPHTGNVRIGTSPQENT
jgi:hypothetical protein